YETIIDFTHQRAVFIRLDHAGNRVINVPGYTVAEAIPLIPLPSYHWGVTVRLGGGLTDTLMLDTGSPWNQVNGALIRRLGVHVRRDGVDVRGPTGAPVFRNRRFVLDTLEVADRTFTNLAVDSVGPKSDNVLPIESVMAPFGVVGFNFRTRQFLLYRRQ
ncbi:MAG: retropepsin-like aspartic protease, partial [Gemmatimonadaceae bacterium]